MAAIEITDGTTITLSIGMVTTLFGVATAWITLREKVAQLSERVTELREITKSNEERIRKIEGFAHRRRGRETQEMYIGPPKPRRVPSKSPPTPYDDEEE